ncbi:hypothetical protein CALCODRAFT_426677 [Calocera cornea HHB12733]|uniref:CxC5 like cysteine cluster associated with KDZ domain-containing protein n=1 Tax=Calocera cornea HHB12733 TaxID=1353952 RepID=A0A165JSV9_9BASI|nr:hypothetical protein CALCODRAFT_426677 [Calocera cornea HHB12733]
METLGLDQEVIHLLWTTLLPVVWQQDRPGHEPQPLPFTDPVPAILSHGPSHDLHKSLPHISVQLLISSALGVEEFLPPVQTCFQALCQSPSRLTVARRHEAHYYTVGRGILPVYITSLRCRSCETTYHLNYYRRKDSSNIVHRHYYSGQPQVLQAESHVLVDAALAHLFRSLLFHSQTSGQAMERMYTDVLASSTSNNGNRPTLRRTYLWDTFYLDALLQHHDEQGTSLILPENPAGAKPWGAQRERIKVALQERNIFMAGTGQEFYAHACDSCVRITERNGVPVTLQAAVTDGVAIGHSCCSVHNCHGILPSVTARFCEEHKALNGICAISDCNKPVQATKLTCNNPAHQQMQEERYQKGKSINDTDSLFPNTDNNGLEGFQGVQTLLKEANLLCDGKGALGNQTFKARFGRSYTHNEQLIVRPCGIIVARATFYGAESVSSVADMLQAVFPTKNSVPDILFYDNNCHLRRHLRAQHLHHFDDMGMPVDVFHFKCKHSEKDDYCGQHCNPLLFPDIYDAESKTWFFNSSAAEQTNAWLNRFLPIVHDMDSVCYDFFLDEMIKEHNRFVTRKLEDQGKHPFLQPSEWLQK